MSYVNKNKCFFINFPEKDLSLQYTVEIVQD